MDCLWFTESSYVYHISNANFQNNQIQLDAEPVLIFEDTLWSIQSFGVLFLNILTIYLIEM